MNAEQRIELMAKLGEYISGSDPEWLEAKHRAFMENNWFIPEFIDLAVNNISTAFLQRPELEQLAKKYHLPEENPAPKKIGLVMAGNIPLVGFHDVLCIFLSGHYAVIKPSGKDEALIKHIVKKLAEWNEEAAGYFILQSMLKSCDAYIATGSNNSSRYFDYYFRNIPSIIRRNRTSVAIIRGDEKPGELEKLADDVYQYFGLGCRNVTKIFVPRNYDFIPLLEAFRKYDFLMGHHKYKNNYDYNLAVHLLNNKYYMTNGSILLVEDPAVFSPISQLNYEYYDQVKNVEEIVRNNDAVQCVVGKNALPFGGSQVPGICDFADGVDTMEFLMKL